ncbi:hypothetical protein EV182_005177 [Spiromyces aspiralis]|uniref:Uncharacterized protein n=1 Tax=Spiromyces aspiralis TaxID=68401 RepID=A0ACC1HNQ2_9FUNG|nr:hypothetical protein EV182_005177 [Spiromyces aspiralis]
MALAEAAAKSAGTRTDKTTQPKSDRDGPSKPNFVTPSSAPVSGAGSKGNIESNDDDEDEWDKRIRRTGCYAENEALLICHADSHDWRKCLKEMKAFRDCMKAQGRLNPDAG